MDEATTKELARLDARIEVICNWLIQGRKDHDPEGEAALRMELRQWQDKRERLLKGVTGRTDD